MTIRLAVVAGLALSLAASLAACADGEAAQQISNGVDVVDVATAGSSPDAELFVQANTQACDAERRTIEIAFETFYAMEGHYPTAEHELVDAQVLRDEVTSFDIVDGVIVPAPGSACP